MAPTAFIVPLLFSTLLSFVVILWVKFLNWKHHCLLIYGLGMASYSHSVSWVGGDGCIGFCLSPILSKAFLVSVCV
jgi:hypothetical protein